MPTAEQKLTQYLQEAHAAETGLIRQLQSQIAVTPKGRYRDGLERHLAETRDHAARVQARIGELGESGNPLLAGLGAVESLSAQWLALIKTPIDLLRGTGGEEKILKNAKDSAALETLEIATYTAIERFAKAVGDDETARLAVSIRSDEEKMLDLIMKEIPALAEAVARAEVGGQASYQLSETGAADAAKATAKKATATAKRAKPATSRKRAGTTRAASGSSRTRTTRATTASAGTRSRSAAKPAPAKPTPAKPAPAKPAAASPSAPAAATPELPIPGYDALTAEEVVGRLRGLTQAELATVERHERGAQARQTVLERTASLREKEPYAGYDEQNVEAIRTALSDADEGRLRTVREYERRHKERAGVIDATERTTAGSTNGAS